MRVLVYGPESSCTRYAARLCASIVDVPGWQCWDGVDQFGDVLHRPLPFVSERWHGWEALAPTHVVLTVRDKDRTVESAQRRHKRADHAGNWRRAAEMQREVMRKHERVFVFSIEAAQQLQEEYVRTLATFLGGSLPAGWECARG